MKRTYLVGIRTTSETFEYVDAENQAEAEKLFWDLHKIPTASPCKVKCEKIFEDVADSLPL